MGNLAWGYLSIMLTTSSHGALYVVLGLLLRNRGFSLAEVGSTFAVLGVAQFLARFPAGGLYRSDRAPLLVGAGVAAMGLSLVTFSFASSPGLILAAAATLGAGFGFSTTVHLAAFVACLPADQLPARHMGWYTAAMSAGFTVGNFTGGLTVDWAGMESALRFFALYAFAGAIAGAMMRPRTDRLTSPSSGAFHWPTAAELRRLGAPALTAVIVAVHIGFVNEMLEALFPIHAADAGMSNTTIGTLKAVRSGSATAIRLVSGFIVAWVRPGLLNDAAIAIVGAVTIPMVYVKSEAVLMGLFLLFGVSRGMLRVTSTGLAADAGAQANAAGLASMVYHVALDFGALMGPLAGGLLASQVGIPATFSAATLGLTLFYFVATLLSRRGRGTR